MSGGGDVHVPQEPVRGRGHLARRRLRVRLARAAAAACRARNDHARAARTAHPARAARGAAHGALLHPGRARAALHQAF